MEHHILPVLAILSLALVASQAAHPSEQYWNLMLPNTPMPKAIKDVLRQDLATDNIIVVVDQTIDKSLFFLKKDMRPGNETIMHFGESKNKATFLPREIADSIPFSYEKLPEIWSRYSVKPGSMEAEKMKFAIKECDLSEWKGEDKLCPRSLESMIDFAISNLGKKVHAISTEVQKRTQMQKYTIATGIKKVTNHFVSCHKLSYVHAVFYCHLTKPANVYLVPLVGADGTKAKAVVVCHENTTDWDPNFFVFDYLKIKVGDPVCHFFPEEQLVWVPN